MRRDPAREVRKDLGQIREELDARRQRRDRRAAMTDEERDVWQVEREAAREARAARREERRQRREELLRHRMARQAGEEVPPLNDPPMTPEDFAEGRAERQRELEELRARVEALGGGGDSEPDPETARRWEERLRRLEALQARIDESDPGSTGQQAEPSPTP